MSQPLLSFPYGGKDGVLLSEKWGDFFQILNIFKLSIQLRDTQLFLQYTAFFIITFLPVFWRK